MNDLAISAISATKSQLMKVRICQPKSLELWKGMHHVKSDSLLMNTSQCQYEIPDIEDVPVNKKEEKIIEEKLNQQGVKAEKTEKKKLVRSITHWQHLEKKLEKFAKIYEKFPKVS